MGCGLCKSQTIFEQFESLFMKPKMLYPLYIFLVHSVIVDTVIVNIVRNSPSAVYYFICVTAVCVHKYTQYTHCMYFTQFLYIAHTCICSVDLVIQSSVHCGTGTT